MFIDHDAVANRLLEQELISIERAWDAGDRIGISPRFVLAVEVGRTDGSTEFAFRPAPWHPCVEQAGPWSESRIVFGFMLSGGSTLRVIPRMSPAP
jgi:hypothetical protein